MLESLLLISSPAPVFREIFCFDLRERRIYFRRIKLRLFKARTSHYSFTREKNFVVMDGTVEHEEEQEPTCDHLNSNEQITISHDDTRNAAVSSVPLTEQLALIMESEEGLHNLEALLQTVRSTDENPRNLHDNVESKKIAEVGMISPQDDVGSLTATTNITFYDFNFQPRSISLRHQKSAKVNFNVEKCENVVVGDRAEVNICCDKDLFNQNNRSNSTSSRSNESDSLLQADGGIRNPVYSPGKQRRKRSSQKKSGKNHALKKNSSRKMKAEWQFPLRLSDFTDNERQEKDIDQWLKQLIPSLLPKIQDLDDFESVIESMEEDGRRLRESSIPNCIEKLDYTVRTALMMSLMEEEDKKQFQTLKIELQFALAEFYIKEDYLEALNCLRALERDLTLREGFESQKGRLYAKIAKVMELCLEFSKDFTTDENELEIAPETQLTDQNPDDLVLSYFQRALESSNNEALFQISCYLGKASVLLKCCKGKNETRNLTQVRENLRSVEILFSHISPALKCQFYLAEAFLLYYEGRFKMAKDKLDTLIAREIKVDDDEHLMKRLERECLGSKRFRFLTEELEKALAETISGAETGFEQIDFLKDLNQIQGHL